MAVITTEHQLARCFRAIDRPEVEITPALHFPLDVKDVVTWSSGPRTFLLFCNDASAAPRGIVFHRSTAPTPDVAAMCEWCYSVRAHGGVKLLSFATDARHSAGLYLCSGLGCLDRARQMPGRDDLPEGLDGAARTRRTLARIAAFAARHLA
jgi:FBP C-terminal treble-clef zinc-finger